jgi:hypothetical protein
MCLRVSDLYWTVVQVAWQVRYAGIGAVRSRVKTRRAVG